MEDYAGNGPLLFMTLSIHSGPTWHDTESAVGPLLTLCHAPGVLFMVPAEYSDVMCGSFLGTWATWQWLRLIWFIVVFWDPSLGQASCTRVAGSSIWSSCLVPRWDASGPWDGRIYVRDGYGEFRHRNLSVVVARCWYLGFVVLDRTYTCSVCIATMT